MLSVKDKDKWKQLDMCVLHCYPEESVLPFLEELGNVNEKIITSSSEVIMLGDHIIKGDVTDTPDAVIFRDFLDLFNLQNNVSFPTNEKGHTLDLILTDVNSSMVSEVSQGDYISYHCFIDCQLEVCKVHTETQWKECCNIKKMDKDKFIEPCRSLVFSVTVHWFEGRQAFIHYCGLHQVWREPGN